MLYCSITAPLLEAALEKTSPLYSPGRKSTILQDVNGVVPLGEAE